MPEPNVESQAKVLNPLPAQSQALVLSAPCVPEQFLYKNRLQQYAQRAAIQLPIYTTVNEGKHHEPRFRSTVLIDGKSYRSPNTFLHRKSAEQDVARIALLSVPQRIKAEEIPLIREDTIFCKSILNEYAVKIHVDSPTYTTIKPEGLLPVFVSSLVFNGMTYTGDKGRNKKEAEQLAARAAILSILGSESGTVLSEIIKSKYKLYAAMNKVQDSSSTHNGFIVVPVASPMEYNPGIPVSKGNEFEVSGINSNMPITAIPEPLSGEPIHVSATHPHTTHFSATHPPLHVFKSPKPEASYEAIANPITFVPPISEQPLVGSTSGTKRKRKNKKDKKKMGADAQLQVAVVPSSQVPPCSVAQ